MPNKTNEEKYFEELIQLLRQKALTKQQISTLKTKLCKKYKIDIPTDIRILISAGTKDRELLNHLQTKPVRTLSGVAVCAIMTSPKPCPHGQCSICPGGPSSSFGSTPQSYTGKEPAARRAARNNYDPYLQVMNRLEQYIMTGHIPEKLELIIMGGTFPSFSQKYQNNFIKHSLQAMNDFSSQFFHKKTLNLKKFRQFFEMPGNFNDPKRIRRIKKRLITLKHSRKTTLEQEQKKNEKSRIRCIGMTIETRPDYAKKQHALKILSFGATRAEIGVQATDDNLLKNINRGHTVKDSIEATKTLKDLGFKINYHMMIGLPGSTPQKDIKAFKKIFENPDFRPDMLKIYPCMVIPGTELHKKWKTGKYKPITTEQAVKTISKIKPLVPEYVRIMRVQRDIPSYLAEAGPQKTNLRQYIQEELKKSGKKCRCIRCREIGHNLLSSKLKNIKLKKTTYNASSGQEHFISIEDTKNDAVIGFCRLRIPSQQLCPEITPETSIIRELHVFGTSVQIGKKGRIQHAGYGKKLLAEAEKISLKSKKTKIAIISGIGAREYYRKQGYRKQGPYMVKALK